MSNRFSLGNQKLSNSDDELHEITKDTWFDNNREISVLVTGGTGFIGSHLIQILESLKIDSSLFVLDYERPIMSDGCPMYYGNLANYHDCLRIVGRVNPEIIFHLAAQPLVDIAMDSVIDTMESNVRGAYNLLEACRTVGKKIKAIVWVSTDKIYGSQSCTLREDSPLLGYGHPYDTSKLCGDLLAQTYATVYGLPIVIVRSGNVYGGGDFHWDRLIPGTIRSAFFGQPIQVRSNGLLKRDYIYVSDIIHGYLLAVSGILSGKLMPGAAINFGSIKSYTVLEIIEKILTVLGRSDLKPVIKNNARNEIPQQHVDFELARMLLNWTPKIELDCGIKKTVTWYGKYFRAREDNSINSKGELDEN